MHPAAAIALAEVSDLVNKTEVDLPSGLKLNSRKILVWPGVIHFDV